MALEERPEDTHGSTRFGKLFDIQAAETGKARSPTGGSRVRPTISDEEEAECSHEYSRVHCPFVCVNSVGE